MSDEQAEVNVDADQSASRRRSGTDVEAFVDVVGDCTVGTQSCSCWDVDDEEELAAAAVDVEAGAGPACRA